MVAVVAGLFAVLTGRRLRLSIDRRWHRPLVLLAVAMLAVNWASKLLFLGY